MSEQVFDYEKIIPCNQDYPYAFISYSSKDGNRVWKDVVELQNRGYNIWIDKNLKPTDSSWKIALDAIEHFNCKVVVYYLSHNSVTSEPCRQELLKRTEDKAKHLHNGEIPLVVVEAEPISDIQNFRNGVYNNVSGDIKFPIDEKTKKLETLGKIMDDFFPNNDKPRIINADSERKGDYYEDISSCLDKVKWFDLYEQFKNSLEMLKKPINYKNAIVCLERAESKYDFNAAMFLAFLYREGIIVDKDEEKSEKLKLLCGLMLDKNRWHEEAVKYTKEKELEKALVLYLGIAMQGDELNGFEFASKIFLNLRNYHFAEICLRKIKDKDEIYQKAYKAVKMLLQKGELNGN